MTEQELKQLYYLNRETERLQAELRQLELELEHFDGYKGSRLSHAPKSAGTDMFERLGEMLDDKQILIDAIRLNLARIQRERTKLEKYIGGICDAQMRLIFRLRHINGMTWEDIGAELQYSDSGVRMKYKRYLKKCAGISV